MSPHLSTLTLHRLRYGELSGDEATRVRTHLDTCDQCAALLRSQENHRAAFELQPVPDAIRKLSEAPEPANSPWRWPRWIIMGLALAAAMLFAVVVAPQMTGDDARSDVETVRTKGSGEDFEVWLDTPDGPVALRNRGKVHAGDRIQVRFRRPSDPWVTLAGADTRGEVEIYGTWTTEMDAADWQIAPFALELDDSPGDQRLMLVFTPDRPTEAALRAAARGARLPTGGEVRTLILEKER